MNRTPVGYSRTTFTWRNETDQPLTDDDARGLIGSQITVSHGGVALAAGTVTCAQVVDDGARMQMTVETGGRRCPVCGVVYPPETADQELQPIEDLRQRMPGIFGYAIYGDLPGWTRVCFQGASCRIRRLEN